MTSCVSMYLCIRIFVKELAAPVFLSECDACIICFLAALAAAFLCLTQCSDGYTDQLCMRRVHGHHSGAECKAHSCTVRIRASRSHKKKEYIGSDRYPSCPGIGHSTREAASSRVTTCTDTIQKITQHTQPTKPHQATGKNDTAASAATVQEKHVCGACYTACGI